MESTPQIVRYVHFSGPSIKQPLSDFLDGHGVSKALIPFGAVYVNKLRVVEEGFAVSEGDIVRVHLQPKRYFRPDLSQSRIFENDDFIILNKPSNLPVHPTLDNLHENLLSILGSGHFITHRLDVPTSGLILIAKTKEFQKLFNDLLMQKKVEKKYLATVEKYLKPGVYRHFLLSSPKAPKQMADSPGLEGKWEECLLEIESCIEKHSRFELKINLLTGRTHQIRAQLAYLGAPVVGDDLYGGEKNEKFGLVSSSLRFIDPISNEKYYFEL